MRVIRRELFQAFNFVYCVFAFGQKRLEQYIREFDPGSGRTLAARLTHASRAEQGFRFLLSGGRVSNA